MRTVVTWCALVFMSAPCGASDTTEVRGAVERALFQLERGSEGSARNRQCFTCHSQAMPIFALTEAKRRGLLVNEENLARQVHHTHRFLKRGKSSYKSGRGQGGGVDTAGYALWALEDAGREADDVTSAVVDWLVTKQTERGEWKTSSNRPPSERSNFTATYLALRAIEQFGSDVADEKVAGAFDRATEWLREKKTIDTEDRVFRMLALLRVEDGDAPAAAVLGELRALQRDDGGWSQLPEMASDAYATGSVLYALHEAGVAVDDPAYTRGVDYLMRTQLEDGSWHVVSRSKPFQTYFETGFPHGTDQFISTTATAWATLALLYTLPHAEPPEIVVLPGTSPINWPELDLSTRLMDTAHRFVDRKIRDAGSARSKLWQEKTSLDDARTELRRILGIVEERSAPRVQYFGTDDDPVVVADCDAYEVLQVRWNVFDGVDGEGLLVRQKGASRGPFVVLPDADQTPEDLLGLRPGPESKVVIGTRLADQGFDVLIPAIVLRSEKQTDDRRLKRADFTDREWIYRQAFHMGRHVIGYDIQRVLAAVEWMHRRTNGESGVRLAGYGEGGLIALYAAALEPRITKTLISGCFDSSAGVWEEPIYRNVFSRLEQFGYAEVAALIEPASLLIEHSEFPEVSGHKGALSTPDGAEVRSEFDRLVRILKSSPAVGSDESPMFIAGPDDAPVGPWSETALALLTGAAGPEHGTVLRRGALSEERARARQRRATDQLEAHVQLLVRRSEHVRDKRFLFKVVPDFAGGRWSTERSHPTRTADQFVQGAKEFRTEFRDELMGRFGGERAAPRPRTRRVAETEAWTAYDVVLDVQDELFVWGVLVLPRDLKPGERRPVVVCQHGRGGIPRDTIDAGKSAYNDFAARLAERGFITFAPHNLYHGEDRYRWLDRKANAVGCTLFSFIIAQHEQILDWLGTLDYVDADRIAFYGLSYGGETAVRVPTVLEKYCLSICSGDFNQWTRKVAATDQPFSFMNTIEWEMPYWNLGHTFDYAEMSYLMVPRPFMAERGHHDRVGRDRWVAHEFAKVRWLYAQLGLADRVELEFFQGGHSINGERTFEFLHKHLNWPVPESAGKTEGRD